MIVTIGSTNGGRKLKRKKPKSAFVNTNEQRQVRLGIAMVRERTF